MRLVILVLVALAASPAWAFRAELGDDLMAKGVVSLSSGEATPACRSISFSFASSSVHVYPTVDLRGTSSPTNTQAGLNALTAKHAYAHSITATGAVVCVDVDGFRTQQLDVDVNINWMAVHVGEIPEPWTTDVEGVRYGQYSGTIDMTSATNRLCVDLTWSTALAAQPDFVLMSYNAGGFNSGGPVTWYEIFNGTYHRPCIEEFGNEYTSGTVAYTLSYLAFYETPYAHGGQVETHNDTLAVWNNNAEEVVCMNFTLSSFSSAPEVAFAIATHRNDPDAATTHAGIAAWIEDLEADRALVCLREVYEGNGGAGLGHDLDVQVELLALSETPASTFLDLSGITRKGSLHWETQPAAGIQCLQFTFPTPFTGSAADVHVWMSVDYTRFAPGAQQATTAWAEDITLTGFRGCADVANGQIPADLRISYTAVSKSDLGADTGERYRAGTVAITANSDDSLSCTTLTFGPTALPHAPEAVFATLHVPDAVSSQLQRGLVFHLEGFTETQSYLCVDSFELSALTSNTNVEVRYVAFAHPPNFNADGLLSVTGRTYLPTFQSGRTCVTVDLSDGSFTTQRPPSIAHALLTHRFDGVTGGHEAMSAWIEEVTTTSAVLCTDEVTADDSHDASVQFEYFFTELGAPVVTWTEPDGVQSPMVFVMTWNEDVTGFDINSLSAPAGITLQNFQALSASNYTVDVLANSTDPFSLTILADEATNAAGILNEESTSNAVSASCLVASVADTTDNEPVLDTAASGIYNDEVKVVFAESVKYENTQFFFGSSSCGAVHFTWQESNVNGVTCATTWTGTASWADFTANCDLIRTESAIESVDHIIYQANFYITHTETFDGLRPGDDPITRTITQYMPFEVRLPTSVTATTSPVRIFAPVVVEAAILEQGVSGTPGGDMTGRVGFLTSVQYPFRLGSVTGVTTPAGVATSDADPSVWVGHGQAGTCNDDSAAPCTQFFEWSFSPASGAICELDGEYNVTLEVECQASQVNDCPLDPNPGSVTLSFTLDTTDFCVELVDDLSVSASLETYLSDSFLVVKHDFIDGQRIYAQAPTQAEVSLSATKVVQVSLVRPDASEIFFLNQGSPVLTTEGTQVDLVTVDGGAVGPAQNSLPSFNFLADSELFGIAADQSDFITLKARIELSYDNAGQAKRSSRDLEWTVQATTSSGTVATSFAMSGSSAVATQGTGSSASTTPAAAATVAGVNILFMGAALVVMCTVLIAAVVISRGRAKIDALREQLATKAQA